MNKNKITDQDKQRIRRKARRDQDLKEGLYDGRMGTKVHKVKDDDEEPEEDYNNYTQETKDDFKIEKSSWRNRT